MFRRVLAVLAVLALLFPAAPAFAQEKPAPTLTAEQKLKADLFKAKVEIAQLRATVADRENRLAEATLSAEQAALAAEFVTALGGKPGDEWDWQAMTLKPKEPAAAPKKEN
jgi:hypothetical protein